MHRLALLLLVACGAPDEDGETTTTPIDWEGPGPWTVGADEHAVDGPEGRTLPVEVWFPSADAFRSAWRYDDTLPAETASKGLDPACDEPLPVVLFSHGSGGVRWQSPFLTERLASQGYLVAAPDHIGNTFLSENNEFAANARLRPRDIAAVFDWLVDESPYADCIDASAGYAVIGHSFGGYTAFATGGAEVFDLDTDEPIDLSDPRVWAVVPMAPWDAFGALQSGTSAITVPTLVLGGDRDQTTPWGMVSGLFDPMTTLPRHLVKMKRAGHYSFSPIACEVFGDTDDGCGPDDMPIDEATDLINRTVVPFLGMVRGLDGAEEALPRDAEDLGWRSFE